MRTLSLIFALGLAIAGCGDLEDTNDTDDEGGGTAQPVPEDDSFDDDDVERLIELNYQRIGDLVELSTPAPNDLGAQTLFLFDGEAVDPEGTNVIIDCSARQEGDSGCTAFDRTTYTPMASVITSGEIGPQTYTLTVPILTSTEPSLDVHIDGTTFTMSSATASVVKRDDADQEVYRAIYRIAVDAWEP